MSIQSGSRACGVLLLVCLFATNVVAQVTVIKSAKPEVKKEAKLPQIADEPKTIDPATLISPKLAINATHDFSNSSLREVVAWLQDKHGLVVLVDKNALSENGISLSEPVSDKLTDDPIYLLLNRLKSLELAWYYENEILYITTYDVADERSTTVLHHVGDLLDAGYKLEDLELVIQATIGPESWDEVGGQGVLNPLGDVLFARQNSQRQREVTALLQALRKHSRQTFVNDPSQHLKLREKLKENVSVNFKDMPLKTAVEMLAKSAEMDIRLDMPALREERIREREPMTLNLKERKLETVLQAFTLDLGLTWILRDGVLWITSTEKAENFLKTAVYDVRDLCRDSNETSALIHAIISQTEPESWDEVGGPGAIESAKPGTLVISNQERIHMEILTLLENYRIALRISKPRKTEKEKNPNEVVTVYYRLHANVANDLKKLLPQLVRPKSWKSKEQPNATGTIIMLASSPEITEAPGARAVASKTKQPVVGVILDRSVLILTQTRAAHYKIADIIQRVGAGDMHLNDGKNNNKGAGRQGSGGGFGGGFGGGTGGFGGGFFTLPPEKDNG